MKHILILFVLLPAFSFGQDTSYSKWKPELGWLVSHDTASNYWQVKKIYRVETYRSIDHIPCSTVYYWSGSESDTIGWYSNADPKAPKDTVEHGPCYTGGVGIMFPSSYKGDTIIDHNCWSGTYGLFKAEYYKPSKIKDKLLGDKYEMKENEHYANEGEWYPKPIVFFCY